MNFSGEHTCLECRGYGTPFPQVAVTLDFPFASFYSSFFQYCMYCFEILDLDSARCALEPQLLLRTSPIHYCDVPGGLIEVFG